MDSLNKDVYTMFLNCKSRITEMQCKDKIEEYKEYINGMRKDVERMDLSNLTKEERIVLDKIKVYLDFAEKDVLAKLKQSKGYQWRNGGI